MKKIIILFCISFLMIFSCSSGDDTPSSSRTNLIKDIISSNSRTDYIYDDGNKIARIITSGDMLDTEIRYTYSGDFITEYKTWYNGQLDTRISLDYTDGRVSRLNFYVYDEEYEYYFDVSYIDDKMIFDFENGSFIHHLDTNGNTIKVEQFTSSDQLVYRKLYSCDNKNAVTKNILGFDSAIFYPSERSLSINNALTMNITDYNEFNGSIENETNASYIYEYNDQNYPIYVSYYVDGVLFESASLTYY